MQKIVTVCVTLFFLSSLGVAQAWKGKKRYYPRSNPYSAYSYLSPPPSYANPYGNPFAQRSPYGYGNYQPNTRQSGFPMPSGQSPWSQFGGSSFPMMNGFGSPMSSPMSMSPMGMGSPFSSMSPMGMGSPFSAMSPMGMGSPFSAMSPMGMGSPFSAMSPMSMGSPMGMYSPFSPMGATGFGGSPFSGSMSPFGNAMPYGSIPFNRFGKSRRGGRGLPFF